MSEYPSARFKENEDGGVNLYRYELHCPCGLQLKRSELISSVHKLIRRARTPELCYLVRAFFEAVVYEQNLRSVTKDLKGSISNFLNRVALSLLEEGVVIHMPDGAQKEMVEELSKAAKNHTAGVYTDMSCIESALRIAHPYHRGRLGSVVMSYAKCKRPLPEDSKERDLLAALSVDNVSNFAAKSRFAALVREKMPRVYPLTQLEPFMNCDEFRRVCAMNAPCAIHVPEEYKKQVGTPLEMEPDKPPTRALLDEIGALKDVHTMGKHNRDAWDEFLDKGMKVANETPVRLFNHSYSELETLYNQGKKDDLDNGIWDVKKPAKKQKTKGSTEKKDSTDVSTDKPAKKQRTKEPTVNLTVPCVAVGHPLDIPVEEPVDANPCFESEASLITLTPDSKLLGFKNGTVVGELHPEVGMGPEWSPNERVFFKMGESYEDCVFAVQCAKWQEQMGLSFAKTELVWVKPSIEWWRAIPTDPSNKGDWTASLTKHLGARIKRNMSALGYMPCIVAKYFEGVRVAHLAGHRLPPGRFVVSLIKNLLFAKQVGIKDVGPFNMLVSSSHDVLLVDTGKPTSKHMEEYNRKGLFTSHKFPVHKIESVALCRPSFHDEIRAFLLKMRGSIPCASDGDTHFWGKVEQYLHNQIGAAELLE